MLSHPSAELVSSHVPDPWPRKPGLRHSEKSAPGKERMVVRLSRRMQEEEESYRHNEYRLCSLAK